MSANRKNYIAKFVFQVLYLTKLIDDEDEDTLENIDYDSDNEDVLLEDLEWDSFDTKNTKK